MLRVGMVCRMIPEKREEYLALHREVWPEVERKTSESGIRNFSIFVLGDVLFGYYEYVGEDFAADQARTADDPLMQRWWSLTAACQRPFEDDASEPNWQVLSEAWHLD